MATVLKPSYGTTTAVTITLNALANNGGRQSATIDNSVTLADDYMIDGNFKTAAGSLGTNPTVNIFIAASFDGINFGGAYGANTIGGVDAAFTLPSNTADFGLLRVVPILNNAEAEYFNGASVAALFNGVCPKKFVVVIQNSSGLALDATAGGTINYTSISWTQN